MSIQDRIVYSGEELIQMLEEFLDRMKIFTFDSRYSMLLGEGIINKINEWDKIIRKQKDQPLTLTVCGEFKRGKSSLINAILGEDVVTTNVTTETITTNKISYGQHRNELVLSGGRRIQLSDEELQCGQLKKILEGLPQKAREIEIKRPIEILKHLTIIDTPGLGDSMEDFILDVRDALQQADAVIYVFSALYPLSMQEQLFIKSVIKPQKYTELILASNFADSFEDAEDCARVADVIKNRIAQILPDEYPYMVSALDERCRQIGAERPNKELEEYLEHNFALLQKRLSELLAEKKSYVIPNRVQRLIGGMTEDIYMHLETLLQGVTFNSDEILKKADELSEYKKAQDEKRQGIFTRLDTLIEKSKGDTLRWIEALLQAMENEVESLNNYSVDDIKNNYSMYCIDTLQEAFERCIDKFTAELYDQLEEISEDVSRSFSLSGISIHPSFRFALQNKTWTKGDNVAFVGNIALSSSWLSYISDYVAGSMRRKEIKNSMPDLIKDIKAQYPNLKTAAITAISDVYTDIGNKVKKHINAHFDEQVSALELQLDQAAAVTKQNDEKKAEIKDAALAVKKVLDGIMKDISFDAQLTEER